MTSKLIPVNITFKEPLLGTASGNIELHEEFIASKAPELAKASEELEALQVPNEIQKASTIFPSDDKGLFLWDYQWRGFFKEALLCLIEMGEVTGITKYAIKKAVDSILFVEPRRIYLRDAAGEIIKKAENTLQRPLRAETMRGERIALARSEMLPEGTKCEFTVRLYSVGPKSKWKITEDDVVAALNYGELKGMGQWRGGGWGRFSSEVKAK